MTLPLQAHAQTLVDRDWPLIPTGLGTGDQFRLIFLSSTKRNATSDDIADYNTFIQNRAAAGHTDIQTYSSGFRVVGCTAETDARDNTATTGTGVAIHWLNGNKVADDYPDFYDGDWDDEANNKDEDGDDGRDTSTAGNHPRTGCEHNGTEATFGSSSRALGSDSARVGIPNSSVSSYGPLSSATNPPPSDTRPFYGLSQVFEVGVTDSGRPATPAAPSIGATEGSNTSLDVGWLEPANAGPDVNYDLRYQGNGEPWTNEAQNVTAKFAKITGLNEGATYQVQVLARNSNGDSEWSPSGTGRTDSGEAPGAPTNLTATANGEDRIDLNWNAPSDEGGRIPSNPGEPDNETDDDRIRSYKIEVRSAASNWLVLDRTIGSTDTEYSHRDVPAGVIRCYRVSATNTAGTGLPSNEAVATTGSTESTCDRPPTPDPQMQQSQTPLAASFVSVPPTHDGETPFWLELSFDAPLAQGSKPQLRALLDVTGGLESRFRRKDGRLDHWQIRVDPSSQNAVAVILAPSPPCGESGAVCTDDGRTFTTGLATQIHGPASGNNGSDDSARTAITPVPALPLAGIGLLGLLLAFLGSRRRLNDHRQINTSRPSATEPPDSETT